jgi:hypothetical protein
MFVPGVTAAKRYTAWFKRLVHFLTGKLTKRIAWMLNRMLGRGGGNRIRQRAFAAREISGERTEREPNGNCTTS